MAPFFGLACGALVRASAQISPPSRYTRRDSHLLHTASIVLVSALLLLATSASAPCNSAVVVRAGVRVHGACVGVDVDVLQLHVACCIFFF